MESITSEYDSDDSASTSESDYEFPEDNPNKKHKCPYDNCGKSFFRPSKLEIHKRIHTGMKTFKCDISDCDKSYHRKEHLKKHKEEFHFKNIKNVECPVCKQNMRQNSLRKHILRWHNTCRKWKHQCEECGKGLKSANELTNHMNKHKAIFRCEICDKEFKKGYLYRRHVKSHKEYKCVCEEKFFNYNDFRSHKKNCELEFSGVVCNICNQVFSKPWNLKEHLNLVHLKSVINVEIFTCEFPGCNKKYNRKRNCVLHMVKAHGENNDKDAKFVCAACSRILKNEDTLRRHIKNTHLCETKKEKKPRKTRSDKNKPKIPILTFLTGIKGITEKNKGDSQDVNQEVHVTMDSLVSEEQKKVSDSVQEETEDSTESGTSEEDRPEAMVYESEKQGDNDSLLSGKQ